MAFKGTDHGGNGHSAAEVKEMQEIYVAKRLEGAGPLAAAKAAGYGDTHSIEAHNRAAILVELDKRGMDEPWLAERYKYVLERIDGDETGNFDGQAYNKALLQISYLRGHGKNATPQVAIQQNFAAGGVNGSKDGVGGGSPESDERKRVEELLARVENLIRRVEEKVGPLGLDEVHEGEAGTFNAASYL